MNKIELHETISDDLAGFRLDQALSRLFPQFSRSQLQEWIENGEVTVDNKKIIKSRERVFPGQIINLTATLMDKEDWQPEEIPLSILYEDESLLVINKPAGLVVHPGAGNVSATLVNALLHYDPNLKKIPRGGLIHRLDKDTSGLLLVARSLSVYNFLIQQMQNREINRTYFAIVVGHPKPQGTIDLSIGRHPTHRTRMAVLAHGGKSARTHYKILEKFSAHSFLEIELETGRTHQIRVHMAHIGYPILGDPVYGKPKFFPHLGQELDEKIRAFKRQALHATKISFVHPTLLERLSFEIDAPADFKELLGALRVKST